MTTTDQYVVDDDFDIIGCTTLAQADKQATALKKAHPLRTVYISKVIQTPNGEVFDVIAEA